MIDDILSRSPEEIRRVYDNDMYVLRNGTPAEKKEVAKRHVLKVSPVVPKDAVDSAVLQALREKPEYGLEGVEDISSAPSFEVARCDPTGMNITDRGYLVVAYKVLGDKVLRIFYSIFKDDARRKRAAAGQEFLAQTVEHIRENNSDPFVNNLLEDFKPIRPVYNKNNIVANIFVDGKDLHQSMKDCPVDVKYEHLRKTALFDYLTAHYSGKPLEKRKWRIFPQVEHGSGLIESAVARCAMRKAPKSKVKGVSGFSFSQGDGLPSNMMVSFAPFGEDAKKILGKDGITGYTPIDFEFACCDFPEATIVQRLNKSGVCDAVGKPFLLSNGKTVESQLLDDISDFMGHVDPNFDAAGMRRRFGYLKAENYLLWAARYKGFADSPVVPNKEESSLLSQYFYTLFTKSPFSRDQSFIFAREMFGAPLTDAQMHFVYSQYRPDARTLSLLNIDVPVNWDKKLEELVKSYSRHSFWNKVKKGVVGVAAGLALLGGFLGYGHFSMKVTDLNKKVELTEKEKAYKEKIKNIRLVECLGKDPWRYQSISEVTSFPFVYAWMEKFSDRKVAYAAYLDYEATYRAIQESGGKTDFESIEKHLPKELQHALDEIKGYVDMMFRTHRDEDWVRNQIKKTMKEVEEKYKEEQKRKEMIEKFMTR